MAPNNCVDQQLLSDSEKAALLEQLEELKAQLQSEKESSLLQGRKVTELSKNVEYEENENKSPWDQEYLTTELNKMKAWVQEQGDLLRKMTARYLKEERRRIEYARELEEVKDQLKSQKIHEESWQEREKEARSELEKLKVSLQETKEQYEKELKAERKKNRDLQRQMSFQEAIKRLQAEQEAFKKEREERIKLLLRVVSERKDSFCKEMEDLEINLIEQMSTKVEEQEESPYK